jgi:hypothetical protein
MRPRRATTLGRVRVGPVALKVSDTVEPSGAASLTISGNVGKYPFSVSGPVPKAVVTRLDR